MNAKSGLCPEDCHYCSQAKTATSDIPRYNLLSREKLLDGARLAAERQARTYCIVISARGPNEREMQAVTSIVPEIKQRYNLKVCACLGLLTPEQARDLAACGVDRVNHNLNTSESFYGDICTTHRFADRVATLRAVRDAGIELCSGGIIGMGEARRDVVEMALALRDLGVESIPVNFLNPIDGTPLAGRRELNPRYCLKVLAMFRLVNPDRELTNAAEVLLGVGHLLAEHFSEHAEARSQLRRTFWRTAKMLCKPGEAVDELKDLDRQAQVEHEAHKQSHEAQRKKEKKGAPEANAPAPTQEASPESANPAESPAARGPRRGREDGQDRRVLRCAGRRAPVARFQWRRDVKLLRSSGAGGGR